MSIPTETTATENLKPSSRNHSVDKESDDEEVDDTVYILKEGHFQPRPSHHRRHTHSQGHAPSVDILADGLIVNQSNIHVHQDEHPHLHHHHLEHVILLAHNLGQPLLDLKTIYVEPFHSLEISTALKSPRLFNVLESSVKGQRIFIAGDTQFCLPSNNRGFCIKLFDSFRQVALVIRRKRNCKLCWYGGNCAGSVVEIHQGAENAEDLLGKVVQSCTAGKEIYDVFDESGTKSFDIKGPFYPRRVGTCQFREKARFEIVYANAGEELTGEAAGVINVHFGLGVCCSSKIGSFNIIFEDPQLSPDFKAVLLGAAFCAVVSFFETGCCTGCSWAVFMMFLLVFFLIVILVPTIITH